jgi:hypothetical protein
MNKFFEAPTFGRGASLALSYKTLLEGATEIVFVARSTPMKGKGIPYWLC